MRWLALALAAASPATADDYHPGPIVVTRVDPLAIADDDFARHRDPAEWRGLRVDDIRFTEERAHWRLFRIAARRHPHGPLWFVPHDNENAGFEAAFAALRRYGGTLIAVDSGEDAGDGRRRNAAVSDGPPIDPNRNFHDGLPRYARMVLTSLNGGAWPIIALHTNAAGYDPRESRCPPLGDTGGSGIISIRYCDATLTPRISAGRAYPFDDDDTVAFATHLATGRQGDAFCAAAMETADFNIVYERVVNSDGSLSNYAATHHLAYLNFETRERGSDPADLAAARDRLSFMIDRAMGACAGRTFRPSPLPRLRFR